MIAMRGEMEPKFLKNAKKQGKFFANLNFLKKKILILNLAFLKAKAFASRPRAPPYPQACREPHESKSLVPRIDPSTREAIL
jgi:hypothetical protein